MKGPANIIEIIGRIDYGYWVLGQLADQLDHETPLDKAISAATGFDKVQLQTAIDAVADIVKCKKRGGYIYEQDASFLKELRRLKRNAESLTDKK